MQNDIIDRYNLALDLETALRHEAQGRTDAKDRAILDRYYRHRKC
jgi:hypothetical protein